MILDPQFFKILDPRFFLNPREEVTIFTSSFSSFSPIKGPTLCTITSYKLCLSRCCFNKNAQVTLCHFSYYNTLLQNVILLSTNTIQFVAILANVDFIFRPILGKLSVFLFFI